MKAKSLVVIDSKSVTELLLSAEMAADVEEVAKALISDRRYKSKAKSRYTVERNPGSKKRATYNIKDTNPDAFYHEIKTGTLQRLSRKKV